MTDEQRLIADTTCDACGEEFATAAEAQPDEHDCPGPGNDPGEIPDRVAPGGSSTLYPASESVHDLSDRALVYVALGLGVEPGTAVSTDTAGILSDRERVVQ